MHNSQSNREFLDYCARELNILQRTSERSIQKLEPNEIFVFGSNLKGAHGKGAALTAKIKFGATEGIAKGIQGNSYGIPTKNKNLKRRSLKSIRNDVQIFIDYAKKNPQYNFLVTEIGCGLAKFSVEEMAPMFEGVIGVKNVYLPKSFWRIIIKNRLQNNAALF